MSWFGGGVRALAVFLLLGFGASSSYSQNVATGTSLEGVVKSLDGKPMEGVAVSARAEGQTFTTSVFTNAEGKYLFPLLSAGQYKVRAQAVGFVAAPVEQTVTAGKATSQDFTLPSIEDFHKQLSSTEWMNALPADTVEERRMNRILYHTCDGACHNINFPLAKRFDAAGWGIMLNVMMRYEIARPNSLTGQELRDYRDELIKYLTEVRGPEPSPMKFKALPRLTGDSTQVVVTEYTIPRGDTPNDYVDTHDGSDWSEGAPSNYRKNVTHDAVAGKDGFVYFTDPQSPERTVGRLDPKTGKVTSFVYRDKNGNAAWTHGMTVDHDGNIWVVSLEMEGKIGTILKFDPKTEKFQYFPKPESLSPGIGGLVAVDSKGNLWATQPNGAFRLNPKTGEYTEFKSITPKGTPYGITIDSEDNAWYAQNEADRLGIVNGKSDEVSQLIMPMVDAAEIDKEMNAKDKAIVQEGRTINGYPPAYQNGGKRPGADPDGDTVWLGEIFKGKLAKIDIHTKKVTEYDMPDGQYSYPYTARVDKHHNVWIALEGEERIAKFNPTTEKFTEYPLPSLGSEYRYIDLDPSTEPPTIWLAGFALNKITRVQFRTVPENATTAAAHDTKLANQPN
jgi:streptogramin lyase